MTRRDFGGVDVDGAGAGLVAVAGGEVEAESVEGADDLGHSGGITGDHALGEGAVFVGAGVVDGVDGAAAGEEKRAMRLPPTSRRGSRPTGRSSTRQMRTIRDPKFIDEGHVGSGQKCRMSNVE